VRKNSIDANDAPLGVVSTLSSTFIPLPSSTFSVPESFRKLARLKSILEAAILFLHICNLLDQTGIRSHQLLYLSSGVPFHVLPPPSSSSPQSFLSNSSSCMADLRLQRWSYDTLSLATSCTMDCFRRKFFRRSCVAKPVKSRFMVTIARWTSEAVPHTASANASTRGSVGGGRGCGCGGDVLVTLEAAEHA
jgi:hypothetical protein